jgi:hypothetical protein
MRLERTIIGQIVRTFCFSLVEGHAPTRVGIKTCSLRIRRDEYFRTLASDRSDHIFSFINRSHGSASI